MESVNKLKIKAIKTDIGYYIQLWNDNRSSYDNSGLLSYFFDGERPQTTHDKSWVKISKFPQKIEQEVSQSNINYRYELIDKTMVSDKIPLVFIKENVAFFDFESKYNPWVWKSEYAHLKSLYEEKSDPQPNLLVNIEFEFNVICEIDNIKEYAGFSYLVQKTQWFHEGLVNITNKDVQYQLIDKIVFPDIILPSKPCQLTSEQSYKIIRQFIKENINLKVAAITSSHNFCFTVEKKIELTEPESYQADISRFGAKKSKYVTKYRNDRRIRIFEMTYSPENYKGYTPIPGFRGKNNEDLENNINKFLKDLIEKINEPLKDCPHCKGMGVILQS